MIFIGLCGAYFIYFSLLSIIAICIYLLQIVTINGKLSRGLSSEGLSEPELRLLGWYRFGLFFLPGVAIFYLMQVVTMIKPGFN